MTLFHNYFSRMFISRHPRRYFFVILVLSGLIYWHSNIYGIRFQDVVKDLKASVEHDHQHSHHEAASLDYILIKDIGIQEMNKLLDVKDLAAAKSQCNKANDKCVGIVRGNELYTLVKQPATIIKGTHTFYLKSTMAEKISFEIDYVQCVVPEEKKSHSSESPGCKLPTLNPWDQSIRDLIQPREPMQCPGNIYTSYQNGVLKFVQPKDSPKIDKISYKPITGSGSIEVFNYGDEESLPLDSKGINLTEDFLEVKTYLSNGESQTDYHAQVVPKPHVLPSNGQENVGIPLNIVILGLDGNSHTNFQRFLPESYKFLKDDLNAYIFNGFSVLGEATTPQLTGLLTGKTVEDNCAIHEARRGKTQNTVDEWPFIFKTLHKHGYITLFSEDAPKLGAFQLRLNEFKNPPAHHYSRPFWWALPADDMGIHENCFHSQPQHVLHLKYLQSFMNAYPNRLKFGFAFLSSLCHQSFNLVSSGAKDIHNFLQSIKPYLNNTMLVVMGDHGARFDEIRATLQGKLEERLPFLAITLPEWFRQKYPTFAKNLQENTQRIITPLDVHATFMHVLKYPKNPSRSDLTKGSSLFEFLPSTRECKDASIPAHFCPCMLLKPIPITNNYIQIGAILTVKHINKMLSEVSQQCHKLELIEIISAVQRMPNKNVQRFNGIKDGIGLGVGEPIFNDEKEIECTYEIQLKTRPNMAVFESTVKVVGGSFVVYGDISRVNRYGTQSECIVKSHPYLRRFCLCRGH